VEYMPKDGDEVWYTIRVRAEIMRANESNTHAVIKILTGELKGQVIEVPLEMVTPVK
jgi:hypothetical protein